jgi:hypothetical protein
MDIFREIQEIRKAVFGTKAFFLLIFQHFFKNLGPDFSSFLSEIISKPIAVYTCLIQKSLKFIIFIMFFSRKKIPAHTGPHNFAQKIMKMNIFKAKLRIVKIVIVQKSY